MPYDTAAPMGMITRQSSEEDIDTANRAMRSQPWYLEYLQSIGQNPNAVRLSGDQRKALERLVMQHVGVEEAGLNIDHSGNIDKVGHKLRNGLIIAGIAAGGYFAAPAIAGALAGGGAGAGGAAAGGAAGAAGGAGAAGAGLAGGVLPSTIIGTGMVGPIAGGTGLAGGLGAAGAAGAVGAGTAAGVLPSTAIGAGYIPAVGGTGIVGGVGGGTGVATGGSILSRLGSTQGLLKNAGMAGQAVSNASSAAGNTRRADTDTNVSAQSAYNQALLSRAALEQKQRDSALRDVYAAGYFRDMPRSPYNPVQTPRGVSQNYLQALGGLEGQAMQRLQQGPQYGTNQMAPLNPYATRAGIGERIGNWVGPALSIAGAMGGRSPYQYRTPPYVPYGTGY